VSTSGANLFASLKVLEENSGACVVTIAPDRGERYLNLGLYGCNAQTCRESTFCKSGLVGLDKKLRSCLMGKEMDLLKKKDA